MPLPISPVVPGLEPYEINFGVDQPEYIPLPALRSSRATGYKVMSRWQLSDEDRAMIAAGYDIYLTQLSFGHEYQPTTVVIAEASACGREKQMILDVFELDKELDERLKNL